MVPNLEGFTDKKPISPMTSTSVNKSSTKKSLCLFTNILDYYFLTAIHRFGAAKLKRK